MLPQSSFGENSVIKKRQHETQVIGSEAVSISSQGIPKSVVRKVSSSGAIKTHSANGLAVGVPKSVVRKVNHSGAFDTHSVNGVAVELQALEKRVETIENALNSTHLSLQQVMTCPNNSPATKTLCLDGSKYDDIVNQITTIMHEYNTSSPCTNDNCTLADFAGCTLRAAGHDFMDFRNDAGGSDGCLRFDDPDNMGLINCLRGDFNLDGDTDADSFNKTLHDVYKTVCDVVSLADFMVVAGEAVMGFTATSTDVHLSQDFRSSFLYGRTTSATCENAVALPNPLHGCAANEVTFLAADAFGMTWRETAALMGVHTIGKASIQNSGYAGWWQDEQNVARFNNNYFISIVNHGWGPDLITSSGKSQWIREDSNDDAGDLHPEMMLNTDMCLVYLDVFAESSNCCAWQRFNDLKNMNITESFEGSPIYCGGRFGNNSFAVERHWCCKNSPNDCTTASAEGSLVPQGPAAQAVHEFAANQTLWLNEFKAVWKLATEKGAGTLKGLEGSCATTTTTTTTTRDANTCYVTVYEHWPAGISAGISGLEAAELAWGGHFPTGASMVLHGTGDRPLGALSNLTSSVKVEGLCCKAYGYTTTDCSGSLGSPIETTTQLLQDLPAGVVTPATGLASVWGCNDCAQCVKVIQECPTSSPTPAPTTQYPTPAPTTQSPTSVPTTQSPTSAPTTQSPTPAPTTHSCMSGAISGRSPGSSLESSTTQSTLEACETFCEDSSTCLAITYRATSQSCWRLPRAYEGQFEAASDDCVVSNKVC
jgi:hypothetical protein